MSAPYRISRARPASDVSALDVTADGGAQDFKSYLDRLMKMIPGEVIGLYLVGNGFIPSTQNVVLAVWAVVCLAGVVAVKALGTADSANGLPPDWIHVGISSVSFVIWVYTMGGPFAAWGLWVPYIGSLMVLAWTFFVPLFYKGPATGTAPVAAVR